MFDLLLIGLARSPHLDQVLVIMDAILTVIFLLDLSRRLVVADRRRYRGRWLNQGREVLARTRAFSDSYLFGVGPRHLGPPIPIVPTTRPR